MSCATRTRKTRAKSQRAKTPRAKAKAGKTTVARSADTMTINATTIEATTGGERAKLNAPAGHTRSRRVNDAGGMGPAETPANLTLRPAGASDAAPLGFFFDAILRRDYFMRRGQLEELIKSERHQVLVAELDGVLVGAAVTTRASRLVNALIHPAYRGLGIGRALVERSGAAEVRAKLDMSTGDPSAFYHRLGYVSTNKRNAKGNIEILRRKGSASRDSAGAESGD